MISTLNHKFQKVKEYQLFQRVKSLGFDELVFLEMAERNGIEIISNEETLRKLDALVDRLQYDGFIEGAPDCNPWPVDAVKVSPAISFSAVAEKNGLSRIRFIAIHSVQ